MCVEINKIYNEDCFETMRKMAQEGVAVDAVLTSPPYNTGRLVQTQNSMDNYNTRYDIYLDRKSEDEYLAWSAELFSLYDKVLKKDGVVLYNMSYGTESSPNLMWRFVSEIIDKTNFRVADCLIWKKKCALPNNVSPNKLTRIVEFVFVFCRKGEYDTFKMNKRISGKSRTGQVYYEIALNFFEADNSDGSNDLNKAAFSTEFCEKVLRIYVKKGDLVYDSFMGTGTTANACAKNGMNFLGSELSKAQCEYGEKRAARWAGQLRLEAD